MFIKPLNDRLIVKRKPKEEKTKGGIIIPSTSVEKSDECEVISVGEGYITKTGKVVPLEPKVGDLVLISHNSGTDITIDNVEYLVITERELLAIIT